LLRAKTTDADDTSATGLTVKAVITRPDLSTTTVTFAYNSGNGFFEYQTDATEVTADGTYTWEPYAGDGALWSGEQTVEASAHAGLATFLYATGPTVTITEPDPDEVIVSASTTVTWTTTDQQQYKVTVYDAGTTDVVYASNDGDWTVSTTSSHAIPVGYLRNDGAYDLLVEVQDSVPVEGSSSVSFTVELTPPDPVANLLVTPVAVGSDPWDTAILVTWDQSTADPGDFVEYTVYRRASTGPDAPEIVIARLGQTETGFTDYHPASDTEYTYGVRVVINTNGLDDVESEVTEGSASVSLGGVVLTRVASPDEHRAILMYRMVDDPLGKELTRRRPETAFVPIAGGPPRTNIGDARWWELIVESTFVDDQWATAAERLAELVALDVADGTLCARDERGRKLFCVIPDGELFIEDRRPTYANVRVMLREENYSEGVA
jgi:hypothetical protein